MRRSPRLLAMLALSAIATVAVATEPPQPSALASVTHPAAATQPLHVLFVGNSLTYVNNLPALLRAVGASQGTSITTETYAAPGGNLATRWKDGHVADALRDRKFDVVVLQEQGGHLAACMAGMQDQRKAPCAASLRAYTGIAKLAQARGGKVLLFTTWGPDERWQRKLDRSLHMIAKKSDAEVFDAAGALRALRKSDPDIRLYPDGTHPTTQASLMLALALYRDITGETPAAKDLRITAPLFPLNAAVSPDASLESQPGLAGDGEVTVVPASLLQPLIAALPERKHDAGDDN